MGQALASGDVLRGKYRLERVLGRGGMGIVHLATHLVIGQRVAIKVVNPTARERFLREARVAALLESDHVVRILDVDQTEDGVPFMVMELLQGSDLGVIAKRDGKLPVATVVGWMLEACEALAEAHAAGIVHRDLKPSNLFLTEKGVKLLDFGISKLTTGEDVALTDTRAVIGSPLFMSPEQLLSSRDVDHRTDIWSLGVTLYQLVSGSLPFDATTASGLGAQIAATAPRPLSQALPDVPAALDAAVMRCLSRLPSDRFEDVLSFARAIAPLVPNAPLAEIQRAAERGARPRALPRESNEAPAPIEASGERWTQSRVSEEPRWTVSRSNEPAGGDRPPERSFTGVNVQPDERSRSDAGPPSQGPPPQAPERSRSEAPAPARGPRATIGIALLLLLLIGGAGAAFWIRSRMTKSIAPTAPSTTNAPSVATPVSEATSGTTPAGSATSSIAASSSVAPPSVPRGTAKPRATSTGKWSKDPSELELK